MQKLADDETHLFGLDSCLTLDVLEVVVFPVVALVVLKCFLI